MADKLTERRKARRRTSDGMIKTLSYDLSTILDMLSRELNEINFGAICYSLAQNRCSVEITKCYGCGICRVYCLEEAITLHNRKQHPTLNKLW